MNVIIIVILNWVCDGILFRLGLGYFDICLIFFCKILMDGVYLVWENDGGKSGDSF